MRADFGKAVAGLMLGASVLAANAVATTFDDYDKITDRTEKKDIKKKAIVELYGLFKVVDPKRAESIRASLQNKDKNGLSIPLLEIEKKIANVKGNDRKTGHVEILIQNHFFDKYSSKLSPLRVPRM